MQRVGIFSGTFDPVHDGHVAFARQALRAYKLDRIFFLVEPRPRRKQGVKAFQHRQKMVDLAIADDPSFGSIVLEQARFTVHQTLPILQARFKGSELFMLMGDDMLHHLGDWPHVDELLKQVGFLIGRRRISQADARAHVEALEAARGLKLQYEIFQSEHSEYASSKIRLNYKKGQTPQGLNPQVKAYIDQAGLYGSA